MNMKKIDKTNLAIINELIRNSRVSDRQLAKKLKISQPTVSRRIKELDKERMLEYTAVPDLRKLGFEIIAFTFGKWDRQQFPDTRVEEMRDFISKHPNIIFVSTGQGEGWDRVGISVHRNYSEYHKLIQEFKSTWGQYFGTFCSFIVSLQSDNVLRSLSFKWLTDALKEENL